MQRSNCALLIGEGTVAAGTNYGVVFYNVAALPAVSEPSVWGPRPLTQIASRIMLPDSVNDLLMAKGVLYAANGPMGVVAIDVSDPLSPRVLSQLPLPGAAMGLASEGQRLFVAMGVMGVGVVDISDANQPSFRNRVEVKGYVRQILVQKGPEDSRELKPTVTIVAAAGSAGLIKMELDCAGGAVSTHRMGPEGDVRSVAASGSGLVVAVGKSLCRFEPAENCGATSCMTVRDTVRTVAAAGQTVFFESNGHLRVALWIGGGEPTVVRDVPVPGPLLKLTLLGGRLLAAADFAGILLFDVKSLVGQSENLQ